MLILHDGNPLTHINRSWVNHALMTAMVGVFLLQLGDLVSWRSLAFFPAQLWHLWPSPGPLNGILGLVTHQFLHGNILHILANLVALRVFGDNIEDALGHWRYALFFLGSGAIAAMTQGLLSDPYTPLIGASGSIAAVMAGYLLLHPRARILVLAFNVAPILAPASLVVGFGILVNIAMAYDITLLTGGPPDPQDLVIAWWAHVGGFACGLAFIPLLKARNVPLFQPPPMTQGAGMRWLGRLIPSLSWPGDRPFAEDTTAAVAAAVNPGRTRLLVFVKAVFYILLIFVLMRYL
ncbi:MAG: rhomboid family intramembrane serine protease [Dongiaceae bacterium]